MRRLFINLLLLTVLLPAVAQTKSSKRGLGWHEASQPFTEAVIQKLAPGVADRMVALLDNARTPAIAKVRILEIILERTYGKAETAVRLNADIQSNEAARARLEAIAARIRLEVDG